MLYQAWVAELKEKRITKSMGHIAVCMRYYPRFLNRTLCHEYIRALAPSDELFTDFRAALERTGDQNQAFEEVEYEKRFELGEEGLAELARLCDLARTKDVYLVCQCAKNEKCHRHLLLLLAERLYGAQIDRIRFEYPDFRARLEKIPALG
jgi:uncharacterized protein YeaO (DUF488 family)